MTAIRIIDDHTELASIGVNTHAQIDTGLTKLAGIESGATADQTKADIDALGLSHDNLVDVSTDDHHNESHSVVSHSDTTATGAQLDTLTDNSIANALHRHSELVASDGAPDPAVSCDATGRVGVGTSTPGAKLTVSQGGGNWTDGFRLINGSNYWDFLTGNAGKLWIGYGSNTKIVIDTSGHVGLGGGAPATSALLELESTTAALLLSRMTTTQKNALTAVDGMLVYDSTLNKFQGHENGAWTNLI